jgi:hypothetical protein
VKSHRDAPRRQAPRRHLVLVGLALICAIPGFARATDNRAVRLQRDESAARASATAQDIREQRVDKQERKWREALGLAVIEGRCEDARRIALDKGDPEGAGRAARQCVPARKAR